MTTAAPTAPITSPGSTAPRGEHPPAVVVGVDGSECGLAAVRWAAEEAARRGAPLRILHAAPYLTRQGRTDALRPRARQITARAYTLARHTAADVATSTEIVAGEPRDTLLAAIADAELLVLGSSATGAPDEFVLASVAVRVVARSRRPVVVVPRHRAVDAPARPVVAVLSGTDPADDEAVAAFAAESARRGGHGLTVLQTRPLRGTAPAGWPDDAAEWSRRYPDLTVSVDRLPDPRPEHLVLATCPAPLLVLGAGSGDLLHRGLDGLHRWLLRHCTSPMALVPPAHRPSDDPREEIIALG